VTLDDGRTLLLGIIRLAVRLRHHAHGRRLSWPHEGSCSDGHLFWRRRQSKCCCVIGRSGLKTNGGRFRPPFVEWPPCVIFSRFPRHYRSMSCEKSIMRMASFVNFVMELSRSWRIVAGGDWVVLRLNRMALSAPGHSVPGPRYLLLGLLLSDPNACAPADKRQTPAGPELQ
jgi:hypothetical protein